MSLNWAGGSYGEGTFSGVLSPWGFIHYHVVDINSDGYEDIIAFEGVYPPTPEAPYPIHFLIADGTGGYTDQTTSIVPGGLPGTVFVNHVETADFNDDGLPDLFISDYGYDDYFNQPGGSNILLLSNPDGTLFDASAGLNDPGLVGYAVAGDIDGDGDLDIFDLAIGPITDDGVLGSALYINDGSENFTDVSGQLPDWITDQSELGGIDYISNNFYNAELYDLNGDGAAELILGQAPLQGPLEDAQLNNGPVPAEAVIFWNDGAGNFSNNSFTALASPIWGRDADYSGIEVADFNGDGEVDILTVSSDGTAFQGHAFTLQTGDGNGNFTDVTASAFPLGYWEAVPTIGRLVIVDIELDGDLDIVGFDQNSGDGSEAPLVWLNNGSGVFTETVYWSSILDRGYPSGVVLAPDGTGYNFVWGVHDPNSQTGYYFTYQTQFDLTQVRTIQGTDDFDQIIGGRNNETIHGLGGKDILFGHAGSDSLFGGGDNDKLFGGTGNDMLFGGAGADAMDGGADFDYARYDDMDYGDIRISLQVPALNTGAAAGDTFTDIEGLIMGTGNDWIYGDGASNYLYGGGGNDNIFGSIGADYHHGGAGLDYARYDDAAYGDINVSLAAPSIGTSVAAGDIFVEIEGLILGGGNDWIYGDNGNNYLYGNSGNDNIFGSNGADYIHGGTGFDYARFDDAGYAGLVADLVGANTNTGAAAGDTFVEIEGLILTGNNDYGFGNDLANYIYGLGGDDNLYGRGGADYLSGGIGNDTLTGGSGNDIFAFGAGYGRDTITDFQGGSGLGDQLGLQGSFASFAAVLAASTQVGVNLEIALNGTDVLVLENFSISNFAEDDMIV